jgi:hypothetical protein
MKLLLVLFLSVSLFASVIEAPDPGGDFEQNPSSLEWKHIETEHFDIIFPAEVEREALRVAHLVERAWPYVTRSMEEKPPRIPLILQNQSVHSNGFVTLAPRRSEWYITPSIDPEITNTEWLKTLAIHEFRHVVQFQKGRKGFNKALYIVLGQIGQALGLALTMPPWFFEGDAVGIETALTKGGRGRLPLFDRDLRTLLVSGNRWNYDKAHLGSYRDYIPNHYVYGYFYTSWMRNEYGDLFLSKLANTSAETSWNPLSFYQATEKLTKTSFEDFYEKVMKDLIREWTVRTEAVHPTPFEVKNRQKKFGWTNYSYPQSAGPGKVLALKSGLSFIHHFVMIEGNKEKILFYPGPLPTQYPFKLRGNKLAFFETEVDPRWGYRDYARLKVYDLDKEKFILDKRRIKGRLAVPDHSGEHIAWVEWNEKQEQKIIIHNVKEKKQHSIFFPTEDVITGVDWLSAHELVIVIKDRSDLKGIEKLNLRDHSRETLLPKKEINIGFVTVEDQQIFYESPETGVDNIFTLTKSGPLQLTSSKFGAYAPDIHEGQLLYNDYNASGMNIATKFLPVLEEQKSGGSFFPVYESFSKSENFQGFDKDLKTVSEVKASSYSQLKNSINLHSWMFLAPPLSNTLTAALFSRDVLNKFILSTGGEYNLNEQTLQGFVSATWMHYYPVFDLKAAFGNRRQTIMTQSQKSFEDRWQEGSLEAGMGIPWRYIQGRFTHSFTLRAFSRLINITSKSASDRSELSNGAFFSPGFEFSYSVQQRLAFRDMNPPLGLSLSGRAEEGRDISGSKQRGSLQSGETRLYLPGAWYHHSFYQQLAYERQRDSFYQYASFVFYPRGTRNVFLEELTKYSANYLLPLFYPDTNLSRYIYWRRIALNLFYDELNGRVEGLNYRAASAGWETIFEMSFLRLMLPVSIGIRGSYILDGFEKKQNYEIFLASTLGTF